LLCLITRFLLFNLKINGPEVFPLKWTPTRSETNWQIGAGFDMVREAGITNFTK